MMNNSAIHLDSRYDIPAGIQFRYEDFGGIIYRRGDDKLFFLNSHVAIDLLGLAGRGMVREIIGMLEKSELPEKIVEQQVLKALNSLKELGIIYELA